MMVIIDSKGQSQSGIVMHLQQTELLPNILHFLWALFIYLTLDKVLKEANVNSTSVLVSLICFSSTIAALLFPVLCERGSV